MSRRSHVVRSEEDTAAGRPRSLGSCEIRCAVSPNGNVDGDVGVEVAQINAEVDQNYQRVFLMATIHDVIVTIPDEPPPPGPGSWKVTFECPYEIAYEDPRWRSIYWYPPVGQTVITHLAWWGALGEVDIFGALSGIFKPGPFGRDYEFIGFDLPERNEAVDPPLEVPREIRLEVGPTDGTIVCELTMYSPYGEDQDDVYISESI